MDLLEKLNNMEIKEFLKSKGCWSSIVDGITTFHNVKPEDIIEFTKYHVRESLKIASEEANMLGETQHNNDAPDVISNFIYVSDLNGPDYGYIVNKDSILNAYSLDNIK